MVGTRSRKRAAEPAEPLPPTSVTAAQVLAAVDACQAAILQHAATVSTAQVLELCCEQLGLQDVAPLRPHRHAARERALKLLEERGQRPASASPPSAGDLPTEIVVRVFQHLDHDSLFCALQACRAWRAAGSEEALWEQQCASKGWQAPPAAQQQQQQRGQAQERQQAQQQQQAQAEQQRGQRRGLEQAQQQAAQAQPAPAPDAGPGWRERYRQRYSGCCYDCFLPTARRTLQAGSLRLQLCQACSAGYDSPRPHHRLVAGSTAKRQYCLKDKDLAPLPRCVEPNPVNAAFSPMHLFRRLDVRRAAVDCWGSWDRVAAEHRRRITRC